MSGGEGDREGPREAESTDIKERVVLGGGDSFLGLRDQAVRDSLATVPARQGL